MHNHNPTHNLSQANQPQGDNAVSLVTQTDS